MTINYKDFTQLLELSFAAAKYALPLLIENDQYAALAARSRTKDALEKLEEAVRRCRRQLQSSL